MKEALEQSLLQDLVIPAAELQWFKPGKEIVVDNQLFDIKSIRYGNDGKAYISGLFDKEESILIYEMKKDWNEQNRNSSRQVIQLFKMAQSLPETEKQYSEPYSIARSHEMIPGAPLLSSGFASITTPPPQG